MRRIANPLILLGRLAAALLLLAMPATVSAEWLRADTRNFVIYSDGNARTLEQFAERAERFDALFRLYFSLPSEPPANRLTIYLVPSSEDVSRIHGRDNDTLAGFYQATSDGSFAVANRERGVGPTGLSGQAVLFHEYVHHLMARYFTFGYPAWYREGFAEYFATATFASNGDWTLGEPADYRAIGLRTVSLPLETVLFDGLEGLSPRQVDAFYGRSWLLVHMFANDPERKRQLVDYLSRIGRGEDARTAFAATFGDLSALESQADSYLRGRMNSLRSQSPIAIQGDIAITALDPIGSDLVTLEMERRVGQNLADTRTRLLALATTAPDDVRVAAELARTEYALAQQAEDGDFTAAAAAADAALALQADHPVAAYIKARTMMAQMDIAPQKAESGPDWEPVRALIRTAMAADPTSPLPLVAHYESFVRAGEVPPVEVVNGLGDALRLAPEAHDVRVQLAYAIASEGMYDDALRLVEFLASDPHSGGLGRGVIDDITRMRASRRQR